MLVCAVCQVPHFVKSMLLSADTFILDCGSEVYVWVGRGSNPEEKKSAMINAQVWYRPGGIAIAVPCSWPSSPAALVEIQSLLRSSRVVTSGGTSCRAVPCAVAVYHVPYAVCRLEFAAC